MSGSLRIVVDRDLCEGNGRCEQAAPAVFRVGDDDQVEVLDPAPAEALRDAVEAAAHLCPRQALRIVDAPGHPD